jgi:lysozyme
LDNKTRTVIAALTLSAVGLVGITRDENYVSTAMIPVPGDVPTLGFGSTDGVRMGDTTTPPKALSRLLQDVDKRTIKRCVTAPLHQFEYDAYQSLAFNIGIGAFCDSTLVRELNVGLYPEACRHIEDFTCGPATQATRAKPGEKCYSARKPMKVMKGLVDRRARERALCEGAGEAFRP